MRKEMTMPAKKIGLLALSLIIPMLVGVFLSLRHADVNAGAGETGRVAISLLREGVLGNPYVLPTGPTAHVSPVHSAYLATIYFIFGENNTAARIALGLVCVALWTVSTYYVVRIGRILQLGKIGLSLTLFFTCLFPTYLSDSVVYFRQWDQPFGALILTYSLYLTLSEKASYNYRAVVKRSVLAGVGVLVSPALLPALLMSIYYSFPPLIERRKVINALAISLIIIVVFVAPWGLRNAEQLGAFITTRSNFGLELIVGNNDLSFGNSETANLNKVHPFLSENSALLISQIGEVAFMKQMQNTALTWIEENPVSFIKLTINRAALTFVPNKQMVGWVPIFGAGAAWLCYATLGLTKFFSLIIVFVTNSRRWLWFFYTVLPLAPYILTHVNTRYLFVVFFPSICLISYVVDQVFRELTPNSEESLLKPPTLKFLQWIRAYGSRLGRE